MATIEPQGDREIAAFKAALTQALGHDEWPPSVAGDLSFLLGTLEQGVQLLRELMSVSQRDEIPAKLLGVELLLADDLPAITAHLLPPLRDVCKQAYFLLGDTDAPTDDDEPEPA